MAMPAIARVVDDNSPLLMANSDVSVQFAEPPRASILNVARRIHPDGFHPSRPYLPFILNIQSDHLLLYTTNGGHAGGGIYLCDAYTGVAIRLPPSPERPINPRRCVGLIEDPRHRGHFLIAQLHPTSTTQHSTFVSYSTGTSTWEIKRLSSSPHHQGCNGGVLAHNGRLWWADPHARSIRCRGVPPSTRRPSGRPRRPHGQLRRQAPVREGERGKAAVRGDRRLSRHTGRDHDYPDRSGWRCVEHGLQGGIGRDMGRRRLQASKGKLF
uniref:DUF1618 domain-containing protein n=1 Tax=Oryza nivara TaxID=4536 RepID=A0A0E0IKP2_ORYNI